MGECKFCGNHIEWRTAYTKKGEKSVPVEPEQVCAADLADGDFILTPKGKWFKIDGQRDEKEPDFYKTLFGFIRHICDGKD